MATSVSLDNSEVGSPALSLFCPPQAVSASPVSNSPQIFFFIFSSPCQQSVKNVLILYLLPESSIFISVYPTFSGIPLIIY